MKKQTTHTALIENLPVDITRPEIHQLLEYIKTKLDLEISAKQKTIDRQELELQHLHGMLLEKNSHISQINEKLTECSRNNEGNRQLINKLLNDIGRLQQDIEWYKRTYEKRTLAGLIKDRLKYFFSK